jgi:hypothetical protein
MSIEEVVEVCVNANGSNVPGFAKKLILSNFTLGMLGPGFRSQCEGDFWEFEILSLWISGSGMGRIFNKSR